VTVNGRPMSSYVRPMRRIEPSISPEEPRLVTISPERRPASSKVNWRTTPRWSVTAVARPKRSYSVETRSPLSAVMVHALVVSFCDSTSSLSGYTAAVCHAALMAKVY